MRFLKYVHLHNYLNLKHAKLEGLKDLNIIIGPNNCGKTSILRALNLLDRISFGRMAPSYPCKICESVFRSNNAVHSAQVSIDSRERYLTRTRVRATFGYDKNEIEKELPELSKREKSLVTHPRLNERMQNHLRSEFEKCQLTMRTQKSGSLISEHVSPIIWNQAKAKILNILFCPEARLQSYKGNDFPKFIGSKDFTLAEQTRFIDFVRDIIDPSITSIRHSLNLVKMFGEESFNTPIAEQGSGLKSLVCLVADILSQKQAKILLIDEPELGLNPSSKHAFLKFLLEQSQEKQTFLATHDPTFVNPLLWNRENVSVYLFSVVDDGFVKVNMIQSIHDPNTFAGFLPHTTSLRQMHIYVEGNTDVYIFQMFLLKYLKERFPENWYYILNKIGIFHLGGDFWSHLLYTIPKSPHISIVILDGDKKEILPRVVENYARIDKNRFAISDLSDISNDRKIRLDTCPIYCLKLSEIEDYLKPRPSSKDKGPIIASEMDYAPSEIEDLFENIFLMANAKSSHFSTPFMTEEEVKEWVRTQKNIR